MLETQEKINEHEKQKFIEVLTEQEQKDYDNAVKPVATSQSASYEDGVTSNTYDIMDQYGQKLVDNDGEYKENQEEEA